MEYKQLMSEATDALYKAKVEEAVLHASNVYHVDAPLIRAIIQTESGGRPFAIRYEPHLEKAEWYRKGLPDIHDKWAYCSFGEMQIMFGVARSHGFKGQPFELINPVLSIFYGAAHIASLIRKYKNITDAVSAYNQGTPRRNQAGEYVNQAYVNSVVNRMNTPKST